MIDLERAKLNPAEVFASPQAIVDSQELSEQEKIDLLKRWAYDLKSLAIAEEENMPADAHPQDELLDEINEGLTRLGASLSD